MSERVARNAGEYIKRHSELQITNCNLIPARSVGTRADGLFRRGRGRNLSLPTTISLTALRFRFRSGLLILRSRESEARSQRLHVSTHVSPDDGSFRIETGVRLAIRNKRDTGAVEGGGERESREQDGRDRKGRTYRGEKRAGLGLWGRAERFIWLKAHPPSRIDR